ncbi:MAG: substrate-binding domain-containing protein [Thermodesulfovibrionales bacterium]
MNRPRQLSIFPTIGVVVLIIFTFLFALRSGLHAAGPAKEIRTGGTGTALATMKLLAEEFRKKHPDVIITVLPSLGSSGGIKALIEGKLDIALSHKDLSDDERNKGLTAVRYARTPFVFVTHRTNKISTITLQDVADIYNGKTITWPDDTPVRLILRPAGEASTKTLERISEDMKRAVGNSFKRSGLNIAINDQENATLLERLPGSFGTATLCQIISEKRRLNVLSLNGVKPSVRTLANGNYPYFKDLYIITGPRSAPQVGEFIDFVFSPSGQSILSKTGHLATR